MKLRTFATTTLLGAAIALFATAPASAANTMTIDPTTIAPGGSAMVDVVLEAPASFVPAPNANGFLEVEFTVARTAGTGTVTIAVAGSTGLLCVDTTCEFRATDPTATLGQIFLGSTPYFLLILVAALLVLFIPGLATVLPKVML